MLYTADVIKNSTIVCLDHLWPPVTEDSLYVSVLLPLSLKRSPVSWSHPSSWETSSAMTAQLSMILKHSHWMVRQRSSKTDRASLKVTSSLDHGVCGLGSTLNNVHKLWGRNLRTRLQRAPPSQPSRWRSSFSILPSQPGVKGKWPFGENVGGIRGCKDLVSTGCVSSSWKSPAVSHRGGTQMPTREKSKPMHSQARAGNPSWLPEVAGGDLGELKF